MKPTPIIAMTMLTLKKPMWLEKAAAWIAKAGTWIAKRFDYIIIAVVVGLQTKAGYDMWVADTSHPYTLILLISTVLLLAVAFMRRPLGIWGMDKKDDDTAWRGTWWTTFLLSIGSWLACTISFSNAWNNALNYKYWTVTDSDGNIMQETDYPNFDPWHNATDPITLSVASTWEETYDCYTGRHERTFFGWEDERILTRQMGDSTCELTYHIQLECDVSHDNVMALHERPVDYAVIWRMIMPYTDKVFENARLTKNQCVLGRTIEVDTKKFDPRTANQSVRWNVATFTCSYRFKPIV